MKSFSIIFACLVAVLWAAFWPHNTHTETPHVYDHEDYVVDTQWCLSHDLLYRSDGIDQPVTCLRKGQDWAVPPNSLNLVPSP